MQQHTEKRKYAKAFVNNFAPYSIFIFASIKMMAVKSKPINAFIIVYIGSIWIIRKSNGSSMQCYRSSFQSCLKASMNSIISFTFAFYVQNSTPIPSPRMFVDVYIYIYVYIYTKIECKVYASSGLHVQQYSIQQNQTITKSTPHN